MAVLFWIKSVQNGLNLTKLVQIGQKRSRGIRLIIWFQSDKIGQNWFKSVQTGSNQINLNHPCPILCLFIFDYWETWLKLVMLENLQACFNNQGLIWYLHRKNDRTHSITSDFSPMISLAFKMAQIMKNISHQNFMFFSCF